ncbi:TetR/AcrR family transcriptional regulator [Methylophilus sp. UBA6697]|jgi:AcrR family transcriptional regulator|uniref:TetR/AcrR family transcriptional regulator n=1 Tax=Methylophilus sp. UBA6697 TaxID=1946902 RepID=UPI000ED5DC8A|nr:TetR/AcrR family transcriptional regulator [Methylophilus sp. UBA6697]HCU83862.1 TetR family transcriptional regulator [Methylophilus sp.]
MSNQSVKKNKATRKEMSHARILETAAKAIRRSGYSGTGVADIMKEAGLTHGGFYAHFASRDEMLAEAASLAGAETIAIIEQVFTKTPQEQRLWALMNAYLSNEHIANIDMGCSFAALGSEMHRQVPEVKAASTQRMKEMINLIEGQLPNSSHFNAHAEALLMVSTMVGTLMLARAVDDAELAEAFRQAALQHYAPQHI